MSKVNKVYLPWLKEPISLETNFDCENQCLVKRKDCGNYYSAVAGTCIQLCECKCHQENRKETKNG
jgi:hypothetical protein